MNTPLISYTPGTPQVGVNLIHHTNNNTSVMMDTTTPTPKGSGNSYNSFLGFVTPNSEKYEKKDSSSLRNSYTKQIDDLKTENDNIEKSDHNQKIKNLENLLHKKDQKINQLAKIINTIDDEKVILPFQLK